MKNQEIKSYIEQAIRKLPTEIGGVKYDAGGIKYYLRKAITLLDQPETVQKEEKAPVVKKAVPMNEQYNFQPMANVNITSAKKVVNNLDLMIEQSKIKLDEILERKKKKPKDESMEQIFG